MLEWSTLKKMAVKDWPIPAIFYANKLCTNLYFKIIQSAPLFLSPNNVLAASLHKTSSMLGLLTRRALILHGEKWTRTIFYEYLVQPGNYYGITRGSKLHYIKSMIIKNKGSISFKIVIWNTFINKKIKSKSQFENICTALVILTEKFTILSRDTNAEQELLKMEIWKSKVW